MSLFGLSLPSSTVRQASAGDSFFQGAVAAFRGRSGRTVNSVSAMNVTAVIACVRVLAEGVSQVPLNVYRRRPGGGSDVASDHPLHLILHRKPNYWQTSFEFRENLMIQVALTGNFYAFKNIVRGKIAEIIPMPPGSVEPKRSDSGVITYVFTSASGDQKELPASAIWHVRGPSWDTWQGMDAVKQAREAIGLAMTTEDAHIRLHENGAQPSGLYSIDGTLNPEQYKALSDWVMSQISGVNRLKPLILDRGAKWTPSAMSGVDAQHLDTRKFQIEEICRAFRVLPLMIGHADKTQTFASAEQMFLAHVVHALMPWYERLEQSADVNLLTEADMADGFYVKFVPNGLMRGAAKDRAEYYAKMWGMGALCPNDIRAYEDQNPYEGGDTYRVPMNFTDASVPYVPAPAFGQ